MLNLSTQKIKELQGFLNDKLLQFSSDEHTPTTNCVSSPTLPQFMAKELDELFNTAFEQHENEYNSNRNTATTFEDEEILWRKRILGDSTPQSLLDTMVYMNRLYFALYGGQEHRNL